MRRYRKYKAKRTWYNGRWYHSKREADRARELQLLEKAGKIEDLEYQPKFTLQASFFCKGEKVRAITYTADFVWIVSVALESSAITIKSI